MKQIYLLNSCNVFKEYSSMKLVMATTSLIKLKSAIIRKIKAGEMEYKWENDNIAKTAQCIAFKNECEELGEQFAFNKLAYGYVNIVTDGKMQ